MTDAELSILLTDDTEIQGLNRRFREIDRPTDVLSFPLGDVIPEEPGWDGLLGDVVISIDTAERQAAAATHRERLGLSAPSWSLEDEVLFLLVHGLLHLTGHDHAEPEEALQMRGEERRLFGLLREAPVESPFSV